MGNVAERWFLPDSSDLHQDSARVDSMDSVAFDVKLFCEPQIWVNIGKHGNKILQTPRAALHWLHASWLRHADASEGKQVH